MVPKFHIVALNIPYPPDYGGVIDIYYKIVALRQLGAEITLHCFQYNRPESAELEKLCTRVHYYKRRKRAIDFLSKKPFIVVTRSHPDLLKNILNNPAPILFEGLHSCYFLSDERIKDMKKIVRTHNVEHDYYAALAGSEKSPFTRFYYSQEAKKLKIFEKELIHANAILGISPTDTRYFSTFYKNVHYVSAFHPFEKVISKEGRGGYILFHGNLSVPENLKTLQFIMDEVLAQSDFPFVAAGKNPSATLVHQMARKKSWQLVANPSETRMLELVREAHICLIPTFQPTGLKLKLLASLYAGRFVVCNSEMVSNTGLESLCLIRKNAGEIKAVIDSTMNKNFSAEEIDNRKKILDENYSTIRSAKKILEIIKG